MAAKTLADLFGPFIKGYSGSYNDQLFAWLQDGAPGWSSVIDPDGDDIPGGIGSGSGEVDPADVEAIVISYLNANPQGVDPAEVNTLIADYLIANPVSADVTYASLPPGTTITVYRQSDGTWPARPTSRADIHVIWADKTALSQSDPAGFMLGPDTILDKGSVI